MFKQQKGITLIALVITIIVLLILAGVTIAMLTGSDSAPAKANEAKQKQDIGAAKDQVYIIVSKAQTEAYEDIYVKGQIPGTSTKVRAGASTAAGTASYEVSQYVKGELDKEYGTTGKTVSNAKVTTDDGTITITTTDWTVTGSISPTNGQLSWLDIVAKQ